MGQKQAKLKVATLIFAELFLLSQIHFSKSLYKSNRYANQTSGINRKNLSGGR